MVPWLSIWSDECEHTLKSKKSALQHQEYESLFDVVDQGDPDMFLDVYFLISSSGRPLSAELQTEII